MASLLRSRWRMRDASEATVAVHQLRDTQADAAPQGRAEHAGAVRRIRRMARLLDYSFRIPGTRMRGGLDPLIGLIPGVGDVVGGALSLYLVAEAARLDLPKRVLARMLGNVALESAVGLVPLLGDAFDFYFKANRRNLALLEKALTRERPRANGGGGIVSAASRQRRAHPVQHLAENRP